MERAGGVRQGEVSGCRQPRSTASSVCVLGAFGTHSHASPFPAPLVFVGFGLVWAGIHNPHHRHPQVSAQVVSQLVADAAAHTRGRVTKAVIAVPAYFDDRQREATVAAGESGGGRGKRVGERGESGQCAQQGRARALQSSGKCDAVPNTVTLALCMCVYTSPPPGVGT